MDSSWKGGRSSWSRTGLIGWLVIDLSADFTTGTVRTRITNPSFDVPTTLTAAGTSLYAVNARFGVTVTPDTPYTVIRFNRP